MSVTQFRLKTRIGMSIGRFYPLLSGCGSFANSKLMRQFDFERPADVTVNVKGGKAVVPAHDYVGRAMLYVGDLDRKISYLVDACVEQGDVALDIGANLGLVSLRLAERVGPTGTVHAFEPSPRLGGYLAATLSANPQHNIVHHAVALGRERATLPLHVPGHNAGAATLRSSGAAMADTTVTVPVHPLSDYAAENGIKRADFVKIDVEGFEAEVVLGAMAFLERTRPKVIVLEENARVTPDVLPPALRVLSNASYDIFALPRRLFRLELIPIGSEGSAEAHDYVAIAQSEETREIRRRLRLRGT